MKTDWIEYRKSCDSFSYHSPEGQKPGCRVLFDIGMTPTILPCPSSPQVTSYADLFTLHCRQLTYFLYRELRHVTTLNKNTHTLAIRFAFSGISHPLLK